MRYKDAKLSTDSVVKERKAVPQKPPQRPFQPNNHVRRGQSFEGSVQLPLLDVCILGRSEGENFRRRFHGIV